MAGPLLHGGGPALLFGFPPAIHDLFLKIIDNPSIKWFSDAAFRLINLKLYEVCRFLPTHFAEFGGTGMAGRKHHSKQNPQSRTISLSRMPSRVPPAAPPARPKPNLLDQRRKAIRVTCHTLWHSFAIRIIDMTRTFQEPLCRFGAADCHPLLSWRFAPVHQAAAAGSRPREQARVYVSR
jgi:hypothetical protein